MLIPKSNPMRDKKWRDSFKIEGNHVCILSGASFPDMCHIRYGFFATGMKPDDNLTLPLRHDLHMEQHEIGELPFWIKRLNEIPEYMRHRAIQDISIVGVRTDVMELIKQIARNYYQDKHGDFS